MRFTYSFTPRNWELGFGFYKGNVFVNLKSGLVSSSPSEIYILFGPFSIGFAFGHTVEVVNR